MTVYAAQFHNGEELVERMHETMEGAYATAHDVAKGLGAYVDIIRYDDDDPWGTWIEQINPTMLSS